MVANFNTAPPPGIWIIWAWIGVCFLASAVLIILDAVLRPRVLFGFGILENERRRREDAEEEIIQLESKVEAHQIRISYLEGENETLRELARRKGSYAVRQDERERSPLDDWREKAFYVKDIEEAPEEWADYE